MNKENINYLLLSICIPTWNRKNYLDELLNNINYVFENHVGEVELIISDNCSDDGTDEVLKYYSDNNKIHTIIVHQAVHIPFQENLIACYLRATGKYVLFLGDDDRLIKWNFTKLLEYLSDVRNEVDMIVQPITSRLDANYTTSVITTTSPSQYFDYFYDFGNAYHGIIRGELLKNALLDKFVMEQALVSVWPQTILGFSSLIISNYQNHVRLLILNCAIGVGPYNGFTYVASTYRTTRSFIDLYLASKTIESVGKIYNIAATKILSKPYLLNRLFEICYLSCRKKTLSLSQAKEIFSRLDEYKNVSCFRKSLWLVSVSKLRFLIYVLFRIYYAITSLARRSPGISRSIALSFQRRKMNNLQDNLASGVKDDSTVF